MKQQNELISFNPIEGDKFLSLHMGGNPTVEELIQYLGCVIECYGKDIKIREITSSNHKMNYLSCLPN